MSSEEIAIFAQPDLLDTRQLQHISERQVDIWIIEGDRFANRPKVLVTRHLKDLPDTRLENIVATIGPEGFGDAPAHFEAGDHGGLGSFVSSTILEKKAVIQE